MTPTVVLPLVIGVLVAVGLYLMTSRNLSRVVIGVVTAGNGINLLILSTGGEAGAAPVGEAADGALVSDPLPQALTLTAIVITLAITCFLLAVVYRDVRHSGDDAIEDDDEDLRVRGDADL